MFENNIFFHNSIIIEDCEKILKEKLSNHPFYSFSKEEKDLLIRLGSISRGQETVDFILGKLDPESTLEG